MRGSSPESAKRGALAFQCASEVRAQHSAAGNAASHSRCAAAGQRDGNLETYSASARSHVQSWTSQLGQPLASFLAELMCVSLSVTCRQCPDWCSRSPWVSWREMSRGFFPSRALLCAASPHTPWSRKRCPLQAGWTTRVESGVLAPSQAHHSSGCSCAGDTTDSGLKGSPGMVALALDRSLSLGTLLREQ